MSTACDATAEPELSLVIPTYDESENIEEILRATVASLEQQRSYEVIVVDDDSPDRTWEIVERLTATMPRVRLIRRTQGPRDQAHAIVAGFRASRGAVLGKMDADGSHDPRALASLLAMIDAGHEVAIGSRYVAGGTICAWPFRRRILSKVSTAAVRAAMKLDIGDPLSGFWLIRREIFDRANCFPIAGGFKVLLQLCVNAGARSIAEVPIQFRDRTRGKTKLGVRVLVKSLAMLIALRAKGGIVMSGGHSGDRSVDQGK